MAGLYMDFPNFVILWKRALLSSIQSVKEANFP